MAANGQMPVDTQQMHVYDQQPYDVNEHYEEVNGDDEVAQDSQQYVLAHNVPEMQM